MAQTAITWTVQWSQVYEEGKRVEVSPNGRMLPLIDECTECLQIALETWIPRIEAQIEPGMDWA